MWADAASLLHQGELLPDDLVLSVMQDAVEASGSGGYVLDGFPRPDTDLHDYEPTPADARTVATAGSPGGHPPEAGRHCRREWPRRARRGATFAFPPGLALPGIYAIGNGVGYDPGPPSCWRATPRGAQRSAALSVAAMWLGLTLSYAYPKLPPSLAVIAASAVYLAATLRAQAAARTVM